MKRIVFFILIIVSLSLIAEENLVVREVKVEGLKRTKTSVFLKIAGVKKGQKWNGEVKKHLLRRLEKMGNFRNITVSEKRDGNSVDLSIKAEDKWTLLGFPMASSSGGAKAYGAGVFESNLLGSQKGLALVFLMKESKPQVSLFFIDQYFINEKWGLFAAFQLRDEEVAGFERKSLKLTLAPGYRVNNYLTVSAILSYEDYKHDDLDNRRDTFLPVDSKHFIAGLNLKYDNIDQKEDFFSGMRLTGEVTAVMGKDIDDYIRSYLRTEFYISAFGNHTLAFANHLSLSFNTPFGYGFRVGSQGSYDALPLKGFEDNEFIFNNVLSGTVEYRVPLKTFSAFTISLVPFFDYAWMAEKKSKLFSDEFISSAGVALRLYIRKVALPALQIYIAHNNERKEFKFGFLMGMSF